MMLTWARAVFAVVLGLACALAVGTSLAQEAVSPSAILTLDQDRFFTESSFGRATIAREASETADLVAENLRIEQSLEAEERQLTVRRTTLPTAEFGPLAAAFDVKVEEIRAAQEAKSRAIARNREVDRQRFLQAAVPVLGALLEERNAVAILDKGAIILSLSAIDVTEDAIARVNAALEEGGTPTPLSPPDPDPAAPQPAPDETDSTEPVGAPPAPAP